MCMPLRKILSMRVFVLRKGCFNLFIYFLGGNVRVAQICVIKGNLFSMTVAWCCQVVADLMTPVT